MTGWVQGVCKKARHAVDTRRNMAVLSRAALRFRTQSTKSPYVPSSSPTKARQPGGGRAADTATARRTASGIARGRGPVGCHGRSRPQSIPPSSFPHGSTTTSMPAHLAQALRSDEPAPPGVSLLYPRRDASHTAALHRRQPRRGDGGSGHTSPARPRRRPCGAWPWQVGYVGRTAPRAAPQRREGREQSSRTGVRGARLACLAFPKRRRTGTARGTASPTVLSRLARLGGRRGGT